MENGEQKTCQVKMHDDKPCRRPMKDGNKCICHSVKEKKVIKEFQQELDKIFADEKAEYYDLTRFVFPKEGWTLPEEYKKDVHFREAVFSADADFVSATFSGEADFSWATFSKGAIFVGATFSGYAHFVEATFSGDTYFASTRFPRGANFRDATFSGDTDFTGVMFSGEPHFIADTSSGKEILVQCTGSEDVNFSGAEFSGKTQFSANVFNNSVGFGGCKAHQGSIIIFNASLFEMFPAGADFTWWAITTPNNIRFLYVSLEQCLFLGTDVTEVEFVDVTWASKPMFLKWFPRNAVYDEFISYVKPKYNLIAQLYRRLQANYINNYRYSEAGDFYIGEQEMMRKAKGKVGQYLSTNFLYKIISYYGESFLLPLLWMLVVLLAVPAVFLYDGINLNPNMQNPAVMETMQYQANPQPLNYEWSWSPGDFLPTKGDYWEAFVTNFSLIAYSRSDIGKYLPESHTRFIVTIESLVIIALLAFFLLALRRKYKRKTF